ncbi:MAG: glycoside hydrolase family 88 protein [Bacteroidota bacterium]
MNTFRIIAGYLFLFATLPSCQMEDHRPESITKELLQRRLDILVQKSLETYEQYPPIREKIYRSRTGFWTLRFADEADWCSGFYPGILWQLYGYSSKEPLMIGAKAYTSFLQKQALNTDSHDIGFKINSSYGQAWKISKEQEYRSTLIQAARSLSKRFDTRIQAIKSWDYNPGHYQYPLIIDNLMNLELLFEASRLSNESGFYHIANSHLKTSLQHHFRKNFSSYHLINLDSLNGEVLGKETNQGFSDESSWARGQAWALYGMTMAYRYTRDSSYLRQAEGIADFFFNHPNLPKDFIPYWDFDAPDIPKAPRDVSAGVIAASALFELATYSKRRNEYLVWGDQVLLSLEGNTYQASRLPFFLDKSTGNMPIEEEIEVPIVYADYYYVEALLRRLDFFRSSAV